MRRSVRCSSQDESRGTSFRQAKIADYSAPVLRPTLFIRDVAVRSCGDILTSVSRGRADTCPWISLMEKLPMGDDHVVSNEREDAERANAANARGRATGDHDAPSDASGEAPDAPAQLSA